MKKGDVIKIGESSCEVCDLFEIYGTARVTVKWGSYHYSFPKVFLDEIVRLGDGEFRPYPATPEDRDPTYNFCPTCDTPIPYEIEEVQDEIGRAHV